MNVLVTGANGFIGNHLTTLLVNQDYQIRLGLRDTSNPSLCGDKLSLVKYDLGIINNNYENLLKNIEIVVHLAGIAHRQSADENEYIKINSEGTLRLAEQAAARGVKRFIFLSTVKVHGETNDVIDNVLKPITEMSKANPCDGYSKSKLEAEKAIIEVCESSNMDYIILRPPLVYGPGVKANFLKLLQFVSHRFPLPFAGINNKRSLIYVENLCDLINIFINSTLEGNQTYLVKDCDISTPDLITEIASALDSTPRLFSLPRKIFDLVGRIFNQKAVIERVAGSLFVDDSKLRSDIIWSPPINTKTAVQRTVAWLAC